MTKVLMIGWDYPPDITGGIGTVCHWLNEALDKKGVTLKIITSTPRQQSDAPRYQDDGKEEIEFIHLADKEFDKITKCYLNQLSVPTAVTPYQYPNLDTKIDKTQSDVLNKIMGQNSSVMKDLLLKYSKKVLLAVKGEHFDLIHAHDWPTFQAAQLVKDIVKCPVILHVHSTELDRMTIFANSAIIEMEKQGFAIADSIISVSNFTKKILVDFYNVDPSKIKVIHNGVPKGFDNLSINQDLPDFKEKIITFCGRITQQKGPGYFVNAAFKLIEKYPDVRFIMAGEGNQKNEMISMVAALGISRKFHFPGFLSIQQVKELLCISDLVVMPSVSEPFGLIAVEAISVGVPVIVSKESGVSEILQNINQVDYWETEELADEMYKCLNHPNLAKRRVFESQKDLKDYSWEKVADRVIELYETIDLTPN